MTAARRDRILAQLRADGGRVTTARRSLITALLDADDHVTADDLAATVQTAHPDVHRSTISRTLDALERLGVVDHVHLGHGRAVYHLARDAHHHLVCDRCGKVVEVPAELFDGLRGRLADDFGFDLEPRHFAVTGRCRDCAAAGAV